MMKINLQINQAKASIAKAINDTQLPISIIRMIIDGIAEEVRVAERSVLEQEMKEQREQEEKEEKEEKEKEQANENTEDATE